MEYLLKMQANMSADFQICYNVLFRKEISNNNEHLYKNLYLYFEFQQQNNLQDKPWERRFKKPTFLEFS